MVTDRLRREEGRMATDGAIPVLWLCGPRGVGKTAVGWAVYTTLRTAGIAVGFVDIDQLGMCYPDAPSDPGRHRMQARNLAAVVAGHRAAGARCVVVSGTVDTRHGVPVEELPGIALTVCRLRADPEQLTRRFVGREGPSAEVAQVLREAADLDAATVTDLCVDTTGLTVTEVSRRVRSRAGGWPVLTEVGPPSGAAPPGDAGSDVRPVLWLSGATGVGKSTVGFPIFLGALRDGLPAAFLDLGQLRFCGPTPPPHRVTARTVAGVWHTFRAAGARAMVVVGPLDDEATARTYADALPATTVTVCRLHAGRDELHSRIRQRGRRGSWWQPGDPLIGRPAAHLRRIADQAAEQAAALERTAVGHRIDTDGRPVAEVVDAVLARTGWPGRIS
jgi:adenylylsulfate kinase-like enzyme